MFRHRALPATLPRARVGFRLQPAPAAALADQPYYPDLSRVVCHSCSGPMRTGSPPSHQEHGSRNPGELAEIGAWNAELRCALSTARRPLFEVTVPARLYMWRFKRQNKSKRAMDDRLPATLSAQQPFHSNRVLGFIVFPGARHAMEKKKMLDGGCSVSPGLKFHSAVRQRIGFRIPRGTDPQRRGMQRRRQTVLTGPYEGVFCNNPRRGIFCADQPGPACEELQKQDARSSRFENSLPSSVQRVRTIQQRGAPQRVGPCRPQCLSMNSAGAGETALASGEQTASTTQNRISGNCIWMWVEIRQKTRACRCTDSGAQGK